VTVKNARVNLGQLREWPFAFEKKMACQNCNLSFVPDHCSAHSNKALTLRHICYI
jgi:hypothetical protein